MKKIISLLFLILFSLSAHAGKYLSASMEEESLKKFASEYTRLVVIQTDLESFRKTIEIKTKKDASKYSFISDDILKPIATQAQHILTLYWAMNLALDVEKRNSSKIVSAFSGICSAQNATFENERFFKDWKRVMLEVAQEESFNKKELNKIKNALDVFGDSVKSTNDFCMRAQDPSNW